MWRRIGEIDGIAISRKVDEIGNVQGAIMMTTATVMRDEEMALGGTGAVHLTTVIEGANAALMKTGREMIAAIIAIATATVNGIETETETDIGIRIRIEVTEMVNTTVLDTHRPLPPDMTAIAGIEIGAVIAIATETRIAEEGMTTDKSSLDAQHIFMKRDIAYYRARWIGRNWKSAILRAVHFNREGY